MKLDDIKVIYDDFKRVCNQSNEDKENIDSDISNYFDPIYQWGNPLANNHGQLAMSEYVEFVYGELFCESWTKAQGDPEKAKEREKLEKEIKRHLMMSNFSKEMMKLIKEGCLYNQGVCHP